MPSSSATVEAFDWEDPLGFGQRLSEEERLVCDTALNYARDKLMPRVVSADAEERFDRETMNAMSARCGEFGNRQHL